MKNTENEEQGRSRTKEMKHKGDEESEKLIESRLRESENTEDTSRKRRRM